MRSMVYVIMLAWLVAAFLSACHRVTAKAARGLVPQAQAVTTVPYQEARHYFIKNTVNRPVPRHINTASEFSRYFAMAATMGRNGQPTPIDFNTHDVLVYDAGIVQRQLDITPMALSRTRDKLILDIRIHNGTALDYRMHPFVLLIVPKNLPRQVDFNIRK